MKQLTIKVILLVIAILFIIYGLPAIVLTVGNIGFTRCLFSIIGTVIVFNILKGLVFK